MKFELNQRVLVTADVSYFAEPEHTDWVIRELGTIKSAPAKDKESEDQFYWVFIDCKVSFFRNGERVPYCINESNLKPLNSIRFITED